MAFAFFHRLLVRRYSRRLHRVWSARQHETWSRKQVGDHGEGIAARYLQAEGCRVLYRNYRAEGGGEVDIVCRHGKVLVFVEVKTRTGQASVNPGAAVTVDKQALIARGARSWLKRLGDTPLSWRYDVVEVLLRPGELPAVNWIQIAFDTATMKQTLARRRAREMT